jgi:hypothetical protein
MFLSIIENGEKNKTREQGKAIHAEQWGESV